MKEFLTFFSSLDIFVGQLSNVWRWLNMNIGDGLDTVGKWTGNPFLSIASYFTDFTVLQLFFGSFIAILTISFIFRLIRLVNPLA